MVVKKNRQNSFKTVSCERLHAAARGPALPLGVVLRRGGQRVSEAEKAFGQPHDAQHSGRAARAAGPRAFSFFAADSSGFAFAWRARGRSGGAP